MPYLAAYVWLLPMQFSVTPTFRFAPSDFLIAVYCADRLLRGRLRIRPSLVLVGALLLLAAITVSAGVTVLATGALSTFALVNKLIGMVVLVTTCFFVSDCLDGTEAVRRLVNHICWAGAFHAVVAIALLALFYTTGVSNDWLNVAAPRLSGLMPDPNQFAATALVFLAFALFWEHRMAALVSCVIGCAVLLTYSRSGYLGLVAVLGVFAWYKSRRAILWGLTAAVVGAVIVNVNLDSQFADDLGVLALRPDTISARFDIIDRALEQGVAHPIFGIGLGQFLETTFGDAYIVHNSYLWFFAEGGLVGVGLFLAFLLVTSRCGVRAANEYAGVRGVAARAAMAAHLGMMVVALGIEALYQRPWWLALGVISFLTTRSMRAVASVPDAELLSTGARRGRSHPAPIVLVTPTIRLTSSTHSELAGR